MNPGPAGWRWMLRQLSYAFFFFVAVLAFTCLWVELSMGLVSGSSHGANSFRTMFSHIFYSMWLPALAYAVLATLLFAVFRLARRPGAAIGFTTALMVSITGIILFLQGAPLEVMPSVTGVSVLISVSAALTMCAYIRFIEQRDPKTARQNHLRRRIGD